MVDQSYQFLKIMHLLEDLFLEVHQMTFCIYDFSV